VIQKCLECARYFEETGGSIVGISTLPEGIESNPVIDIATVIQEEHYDDAGSHGPTADGVRQSSSGFLSSRGS
jgi:hypothetical protein